MDEARQSEVIPIEDSGGNVFADLGFDDPQEELARARLSHAIERTIRERGLGVARAAGIIGIDRATLEAMIDGWLPDELTSARLAELLAALEGSEARSAAE